MVGGYALVGYLNSAELYDPASGLWTGTGSLGSARFRHTATLLPSGNVLVAGGYKGLSSAELYDPATGTWTPTADIGAGRYWHTATLLPSGQALVAGGVIDGGRRNTKLYDPATGDWSRTGRLNTARAVTRQHCCPMARCWWRAETVAVQSCMIRVSGLIPTGNLCSLQSHP